MMNVRYWPLILAIVAVLWAGLLLGVAFLATPVKFLAPSLELSVALDVGRQTFMVYNWVEIALLGATLGLLPVTAPSRPTVVTAAVIALLVALQTIWLLPALDARVQVILEGGTPPDSSLHTIYIAVDSLKLLLLGLLSTLAFRSFIHRLTSHGK